jgi:hypothetical protein
MRCRLDPAANIMSGIHAAVRTPFHLFTRTSGRHRRPVYNGLSSARNRNICAGTGLTPPHLNQDWAPPTHICAGTRLAPATSAPGLGSPLPHLRRDWAHPSPIHTTGRTGLRSAGARWHARPRAPPCRAPAPPLYHAAQCRRGAHSISLAIDSDTSDLTGPVRSSSLRGEHLGPWEPSAIRVMQTALVR